MRVPKFIEKMDWALLRDQKLCLLELIEGFEKGGEESELATAESLRGIVHLIDSIQNNAVNDFGFVSTDIFGGSGDD